MGVSLNQVVVEWGVHSRVLYELEHEGKLLGIRIGNKVWYSRAQLVELLGSPSVTGRQLSFGEYDDELLLA